MSIIFITLGVLLVGAWAVFLLGDNNEKEITDSYIKKRAKQSVHLESINQLRGRLSEVVDRRVSYSKKLNKETVYLQAGLKFKFVDHLIISVLSSLAIGICVSAILNNIFISPVLFVLGYQLPYQIVLFKRNKRVALVNKQVGIFLQIIIKRYEATNDFGKAFRYVAEEMKGLAPINNDLEACIYELDLGQDVAAVIEALAHRTANKYVFRLAEYYRIVSDIGTAEAKQNLLAQAFLQYEEDRQIKRTLKEKITEPVRNCYAVLAMVPIMIVYQIMSFDDYIAFMTGTLMGQLGTTFILITCVGALWLINTKIGAPIE